MDRNSNAMKDIKIEVKVDENVAAGIFSNYTNISNSPEEFIMDFLFVHPAPPPGFGKLMSRVILTPAHAKRLLQTLNENVRDYEERFGEINVQEHQEKLGNLQ
ncbi:MAG: DUF3467 domain-containing protein [bacterium]|nr:DUF3467 domain-containing protein [bacterium]